MLKNIIRTLCGNSQPLSSSNFKTVKKGSWGCVSRGLSYLRKPWVPFPALTRPNTEEHTCNSSTWKWRQQDQKFRINLGYIASSGDDLELVILLPPPNARITCAFHHAQFISSRDGTQGFLHTGPSFCQQSHFPSSPMLGFSFYKFQERKVCLSPLPQFL